MNGGIRPAMEAYDLLEIIGMMTILALVGGLYSVGAIILFFGVRNAPEGFEDENGFNIVWRNNDPDRADVACVWTLGGTPALA